ncbi:MAG: hypothetical protein ACKOW8_01755, partial [Flavobacteriales bacterium]
GMLAVELDALPPDILEMKIKESIEELIDIEKFHHQRLLMHEDNEKIQSLKSDVIQLINTNYGN